MTKVASTVLCKDCRAEGVTSVRPAPHRGPRCATHHRQATKRSREARAARLVTIRYGITAAEYQAIYEAQGGVCFICQRAKGTGRRRLAVDHNHETGQVRGLLCSSCNVGVLGHLREDVTALRRAIGYLKNPPAQAVLLGLDK